MIAGKRFVSKTFDILRFLQISDDLRSNLSAVFKADWSTEEKCLNTIISTFEANNYILDPHTAVAKDVADRFANPNRPLIISATAHYSKFAYDVLKGLHHLPASHNPADLFASLHKLSPGLLRMSILKELSGEIRSRSRHAERILVLL